MPIYKWVREELEKLSYIERITIVKGQVRLYYLVDEKERFKSIPYRSGRDEVLKALKQIREEANVNVKKFEEYKKRKKPMVAHFPSNINAGETDGKKDKNSSSKDI